MNVLSITALSAVAALYFGAINHADALFTTQAGVTLTSYPASPNLSVMGLPDRQSQTVDQPFCDTAESLTDTLAHDFAEVEKTAWVQGQDMAMQLWGSEIMGTWTLLHVGGDGIACVVSSGTGWTEGASVSDILALADVANS